MRERLYPELGLPSGSWPYHNAEGCVVGAVGRWDRPGGRKEIRPAVRGPDGSWQAGAIPVPRPLYRLPVLLSSQSLPFLVVEGERAADAAQVAVEKRAVVTTWAGGAGAVARTDWKPLERRHVRVWPDADDAGHSAAREVANLAKAAGAATVRILTVDPRWPQGHDAADLPNAEVRALWADRERWAAMDAPNGVAWEGTGPPRASPSSHGKVSIQAVRARLRCSFGISTPLDTALDAARAVSVVEVARRLGCGDPVRRGRELHVRCPLHEDTDPSLRIHADGRRWYCDPCGEGGDAIRLLMRARGLDFPAAARDLAGA